LSEFNENVYQILQKSNFMKMRPLEAEVFHADRQMDRETDRHTDGQRKRWKDRDMKRFEILRTRLKWTELA
jgi:hypothetical protein